MGYSSEDKKLDAEVLRKYIYGGHVAEYMEEMQVRSARGSPCPPLPILLQGRNTCVSGHT